MERILVVEDNAPLCWLIERMLRGNYTVKLLDGALDAISWLSEGNTCDVIITDLQMPGFTGIELIRFLKNSGLYNDIPVIVLTADQDGVEDCLKEGASSYILKPFNPQQLIEEIKNNISSCRPSTNAVS